ncbi:unnamed protein product [Oikopleura dioica]|uniref:PDZ domain-containing protein n=1 Tax=Oikopleura dioica TaxID=34765 RepID=E4XDZ7_OIKDI|nr:unnamed protein product [Oikopleura dioica]
MIESYSSEIPAVSRRIKDKLFTGRRHTCYLAQTDDFQFRKRMTRRLSDPELTAPPETLAWLEQFGFKASNGRKKHSFDSSNSSFDTYSFDDADKTIQPLGIGLRSTLDGTHTISFVQPGSPAHLAGLQKNEKLLKINGKLTNQLACYQLAKILSADPGKLHLVVETEIS